MAVRVGSFPITDSRFPYGDGRSFPRWDTPASRKQNDVSYIYSFTWDVFLSLSLLGEDAHSFHSVVFRCSESATLRSPLCYLLTSFNLRPPISIYISQASHSGGSEVIVSAVSRRAACSLQRCATRIGTSFSSQRDRRFQFRSSGRNALRQGIWVCFLSHCAMIRFPKLRASGSRIHTLHRFPIPA